MLLCFCFGFLCLMCLMLPVSLDCPFFLAFSAFLNVYNEKCEEEMWNIKFKAVDCFVKFMSWNQVYTIYTCNIHMMDEKSSAGFFCFFLSIIHMTTSVSRRLNTGIFSIKFKILYNNAAHTVICESWHVTSMWKTFGWPNHFTKTEDLGPQNKLSPATFYWSVCT
jgi:hypothetical protein